MWQIKELRAIFADVWQAKNLEEGGIDSKGFTVKISAAVLEVQIPKELAQLMIESKGVAEGILSDNFKDLRDCLEVWQPKGLWRIEEELGNGALAGRTGRGTIPSDMTLL